MKANFVADLEADQSVTSFFLISSKETRTGQKSGKPYIQLELSDRTGSIDARVFQNIDTIGDTIQRDDIVKVKGRVDVWQGKKQLVVDQIRRAEAQEFELADFLPHTARNLDELFQELRGFAGGVTNPWLRKLLESVLDDPAIVSRLKRAPAGKSMHHAYIGGLLEHIVSLCGLCRAAAQHYPEIDADLLMAGAVLHDIGKIDELTYERSFGYSTEGQLLGHIVLELEMLARKVDAIEGFPAPLWTLLRHVLVSHHGEYEFGSPKLPMFREALMLHYLDDLDSKMGAMRATLEGEKGDTEWTGKNFSLQRQLLRMDKFLGREPSGEISAAATNDSDSSVD